MELAFLTPLLKDGTQSVSGGIAINNEGFFKMGLSEDGGGANGVNESVKRGFVLVIPMESASLSTMGDKCIEWGGEHTEIADVHAIEVEEPEKRA